MSSFLPMLLPHMYCLLLFRCFVFKQHMPFWCVLCLLSALVSVWCCTASCLVLSTVSSCASPFVSPFSYCSNSVSCCFWIVFYVIVYALPDFVCACLFVVSLSLLFPFLFVLCACCPCLVCAVSSSCLWFALSVNKWECKTKARHRNAHTVDKIRRNEDQTKTKPKDKTKDNVRQT